MWLNISFGGIREDNSYFLSSTVTVSFVTIHKGYAIEHRSICHGLFSIGQIVPLTLPGV